MQKLLVLVVASALLLIGNICLPIDLFGAENPEVIELLVGELKVFPAKGLERVAIADPNVADVTVISEKEIMLLAKAAGTTTLIIWDEAGRREFAIKVAVEDITKIIEQIARLLKANEIVGVTVKVEGQKIFLVGEVSLPQDLERIKGIVEPFPQVVNLVRLKPRQPLVQINVEVLEVGRDDLKDLGIKWEAKPFLTGTMADISWTEKDVHRAWLKDMWSDKDPAKFTLKFGTGDVLNMLNLLIEEDKARTLANPTLVTVSGGEASFLVGGEIPIITTAMGLEWKEYGVTLEIKPTVTGKEEIKTNLKAEVRDLDKANAAFGVPAMKTRTASTQLYLKSGETIILAGLIKSEESKNVDRLPYLSKVPILGQLFKSTEFKKGETELVIAITPVVVDTGEAEVAEKTSGSPEEASGPPEEVIMREGASFDSGGAEGVVLEYCRSVQERISQALIYPQLARAYGWEGEVVVGLHILSDGSLEDVIITRSSGIESLDQAAVASVRESAPYPPFSPQMMVDELAIEVPVVYKNSEFRELSNKLP